MKDETSIFGANPDRMDRLLLNVLGEANEQDAAPPSASLGAVLEQHGGQIGRYKLLSVLGEGGMGVVHLAEQQRPIIRRVALKVIKPGMDSRRVIARFEAERQALALLDHPNIAHVYDAGTTENGRPYFVMEYIQGLPITEHCDRHQLTVEDRLGLFLQICFAVHHAHQKGIIHRDLKPSNILVTTTNDQAVPKIIDFGVAKAVSRHLADEDLVTDQGQLVGTPEYMSPEQADEASEDIDTRSDIYSLGVVLYQLLTGVLPFDSETLRERGVDHVRRVLSEQDPKTPSTRLSQLGEKAEAVAQQRQTDVPTLTRRLRRELEWIPLKALRKDRSRRYRSAAEFADDIENYLGGMPLIAGPESVTYRAGKFIRRYRIPVLALGSVAVVLILATVVSTMMSFRATRAEKIAEERAESYRRLLYVNQIALAHSAYQKADIDRAQGLLASCSPDLRDFAWSYLSRLCHVVAETPTMVHDRSVIAVAFSPAADLLATASGNAIRLWDTKTRALQVTLDGHQEIVTSLSFSPDGTMLASGSADQPALLWNLATHRQVRAFSKREGAVGFAYVAFSHDGRTVAVGLELWRPKEADLWLWDVDTGDAALLPQEGDSRVFGVAFSPDDSLVAAVGVGKATVWNTSTLERTPPLTGHDAHVLGAVFLPDSRILVTTSLDGTLRYWDLPTATQRAVIKAHAAPVLSMALSPNGAVLATGSADSTIRLWDTTTRQETAWLRGHNSEVRGLAFSADGRTLASVSKDGTAKLWVPAPQVDSDTLIGHKHLVFSVVFSPDSRRLISAGGSGGVKMWDVASGRVLSEDLGNRPSDVAYSVDLSPDGNVLAIGTESILLWDMNAGQPLGTLPHDAKVNGVKFSPDGEMLAAQTYDGTFKLWDLKTYKPLITREGYSSHYGAVAFSPDGRTLALPHNGVMSGRGLTVPAQDDLTITLWDISTLRAGRGDRPTVTLAGHSERINAIAYSPDGATLASASDDSTIRLWDVVTQQVTKVLTGHTSAVPCLTFAPDGRTLASGGFDGTVRLWNLLLHEQVAVLEGHTSGIWDIAFSPDGQTLASASFDGTVRLWRADAVDKVPSSRQALGLQ